MKYLFSLLSVVILSFAISGCAEDQISSVPIPTTERFVLESEEFTPLLTLTGTVEAQKSISLASKISGRIDTLFVDVGDQVKKDHIVAQFSILDDQAQIAYLNSLNQLETTKVSSHSVVQSAEISLLNSQQQHEQAQRQEKANMQQLLDTLSARTNSSHTVLERILSFLDMTMGVSPRYQYGGNSSLVVSIGNNDTLGKQKSKNDISVFLQSMENQPFPFFQDPLKNAQQEINVLRKLQTITQNFYTLVRNTPVTGSFSESQREGLQQIIEQSLSELNGEILALETQLRGTQTAQEQLGLNLLQTQNAIKNAESQLKMAQASSEQQLQIARNQIVSTKNLQSELKLKAPFDGIITQRFFEEGALIAPGNPLFELADREKLKIYTDIPDIHSGSLTEGMPVDIEIDGLSEHFEGNITRVNPAIDPLTRTLGIEVTIHGSPEQIRLGMFARITVPLSKRKAFFVPNRYIQREFSGIFVKTEDTTRLLVQLGEEKNGMTEIIAPELRSNLQILSQ